MDCPNCGYSIPRASNLLKVFESRVVRGEKESDCWGWTGNKSHDGYARMGKTGIRAHRFSYEQYRGLIPKGLVVDHLCRNRSCTNPDHLEAVTNAENIKRGVVGEANRRKTHCPKGHLYTEANTKVIDTVLNGNGKLYRTRGRRCIECSRIRSKQEYQKRRVLQSA